jgi:thioredoxin 1
MIEGTNENFEREVLNSEKPVLVDFNATWCPPCQALHPVLEELASENKNIKIITVDIDDQDILAEQYEISSIPCLVAFKNGEEIARSVGLKNKKQILKMLGA